MQGNLTSEGNPLITPDFALLNQIYSEKNKGKKMSTYTKDKGGTIPFEHPETNNSDFERNPEYEDIMDMKKCLARDQKFPARDKGEKFPFNDPRYNRQNIPFAGGDNWQSQTPNIASDESPFNNQYNQHQYTLATEFGKQLAKGDKEMRGHKVRGDPKDLMFSNESSQGNPLDTLDQ